MKLAKFIEKLEDRHRMTIKRRPKARGAVYEFNTLTGRPLFVVNVIDLYDGDGNYFEDDL